MFNNNYDSGFWLGFDNDIVEVKFLNLWIFSHWVGSTSNTGLTFVINVI